MLLTLFTYPPGQVAFQCSFLLSPGLFPHSPPSFKPPVQYSDSEMACQGSNLYCKICQKKFVTTRDYVGHMNARHLHRKPFKCDFCGKGFAYRRSIAFHQRNKSCPAMNRQLFQ